MSREKIKPWPTKKLGEVCGLVSPGVTEFVGFKNYVATADVDYNKIINLQKEYVDKGFEIKVMKRKNQEVGKRYKVALWWATMNNLPYDVLQFFWFPLSVIYGRIAIVLHNLFSSRRRFLCSELIATGFYKEGDFLFGKPVENVLPADFDNPSLFEEVKDIWLSIP